MRHFLSAFLLMFVLISSALGHTPTWSMGQGSGLAESWKPDDWDGYVVHSEEYDSYNEAQAVLDDCNFVPGLFDRNHDCETLMNPSQGHSYVRPVHTTFHIVYMTRAGYTLQRSVTSSDPPPDPPQNSGSGSSSSSSDSNSGGSSSGSSSQGTSGSSGSSRGSSSNSGGSRSSSNSGSSDSSERGESPCQPAMYHCEPFDLESVSGNRQEGVKGEELEPLVVRVVDCDDNPMPCESVQFVVIEYCDGCDGSGILSDRLVETDEDGLAQSTLVLGDELGVVKIQIGVQGIRPTDSNESNCD